MRPSYRYGSSDNYGFWGQLLMAILIVGGFLATVGYGLWTWLA
jgi:hypothetical protein